MKNTLLIREPRKDINGCFPVVTFIRGISKGTLLELIEIYII